MDGAFGETQDCMEALTNIVFRGSQSFGWSAEGDRGAAAKPSGQHTTIRGMGGLVDTKKICFDSVRTTLKAHQDPSVICRLLLEVSIPCSVSAGNFVS